MKVLKTQYGNGAPVVVGAWESHVHGKGEQLITLVLIKRTRERRMRNPEIILNTLSSHSKVSDYKFERLYRILFNEQMFYLAYQRIYAKKGNMTPGTDGQTIDQMSIPRIERLIGSLKDESYQPKPARRVYIPKKNGKMRPLGIPSFEDKLVQEVTRMILEAIYEGQFESCSHGFRPHKSCHTALTEIQKTYSGVKWFIEGDIKGFFDNINHNVLIEILKERISDERFIRLIRKFLNAGYIEDWTFHNTYSGTPQGGIISPIMANIYLDKFDKYIKEYIADFTKGKKRRTSDESRKMEIAITILRRKLKAAKNGHDTEAIAELTNKVNNLRKVMLQTPYTMAMDEEYRRFKYVRYADDFLIGIIGSKKECVKIKADITKYMSEKLHLELSDEKTLITHSEDSAKFLGYEISVRKSNGLKRNREGLLRRSFNGAVILKVNAETVEKKLEEYGAISYKTENGQKSWVGIARRNLAHMKQEEIVAKYNSEIRGFYNYFCIANNIAKVGNGFGYIMKYSLYKTLAVKERLSMKKVIIKYRNGKDFMIPFLDKEGNTKYRILYNDGFKRKSPIKDADCDDLPSEIYTRSADTTYLSLAERLQAGKCELCGNKGELVMHHVRTLKTLKGDTPWERKMLNMNRKTLAVCKECNNLIQSYGK